MKKLKLRSKYLNSYIDYAFYSINIEKIVNLLNLNDYYFVRGFLIINTLINENKIILNNYSEFNEKILIKLNKIIDKSKDLVNNYENGILTEYAISFRIPYNRFKRLTSNSVIYNARDIYLCESKYLDVENTNDIITLISSKYKDKSKLVASILKTCINPEYFYNSLFGGYYIDSFTWLSLYWAKRLNIL